MVAVDPTIPLLKDSFLGQPPVKNWCAHNNQEHLALAKERQPTVRDVAKVAGVSPATVTNVLHGRTQRISPQTRDRVMQAIRDIRYRPKPHSPTTGEVANRTLGFILEESALSPLVKNHYSGEVFGGVLATAASHGWVTSVFVETYWSDIGHAIRSRYDGRADAVIFIAPSIDNANHVSLVERGVPTVVVGSRCDDPGVSTVDITNFESAVELTEHLIGLGHRRIAYLAPHPRQYSVLERGAGFRAATETHGLDRSQCPILAQRHPIVESPFWASANLPVKNDLQFVDGDIETVLQQLYGADGIRPTAIVCWNHDVASKALSALGEMALCVPDDVSVAAFDDPVGLGEASPPVTVTRQPLASIGKRAAMLAIERVLDPTVGDEHVRFSGELVVRSSTAPPKRA